MVAGFLCDKTEKFMKPICGLYEDCSTTIEQFKVDNPQLLQNHWLDTEPLNNGFLVYGLFGDGEDGEIV